MLYEGKIWLGTGEHPVCLLPQMANRHGLIAGATGTGKTVSLKVLAEGFSDMGVPVFLADIKGDLAGMVQPGTHSDNIANRLTQCGVPTFEYRTFPTVFWDVFGKEGHPVRTTVSEMGPTLLALLMNLNDTQAGVLSILFRVADDENMLLLDLKDLKAMLAYVGEHAKEYTLDYGNVSMASVGAIQRAVAMLEDEGGNAFFGEPALNIADWKAGAALSTSSRRTCSTANPGCTRPSCCGCCRSCTSCCPNAAIWTSRAWCSSSTRRTCSSTTAPRRCWKRWSRSSG